MRERPRECSRAGIGRRPRQIRPEPLRPNREAPPPPSRAPEAPERRRSSLHGALQPHDPGRRGQATRTRPAGYDVANIEGRIHEQGRG